MRSITTLLFAALLLCACNSVKRTQKFVAQGNYAEAIALSVKKLQKDKASDKNQEHIAILEDAFAKAEAEDSRRISFLKKENSPTNAKEIYFSYLDLEQRQNNIRPLLPLYNGVSGKEAKFKFADYTEALQSSKNEYVAALYDEALRFMSRNTIKDYRSGYNVLCEIDEVQPNYKDVTELREDAKFKGTNFVLVDLVNRSGQIIPVRLEQELLDFNTYGLDNFWTEYHSQKEQNLKYTFGISMIFREINIGPEQLFEKEYIRKKEIADGFDVKRDRNGRIIKDSLGNSIKIPKLKIVSATVRITEQQKAIGVSAMVIYRDLIRQRETNNFPLATEFAFQNIFATFRGDERALTVEDSNLLRNQFVQFPSNAQILLDAGDDVKLKLKDILSRNSLN